MNLGLYAWWLAPVLGLTAIGLSMFVGDKHFFSVASYRDAVPTLYFMAATSAAVACAEVAELFFHFDRSRHDELIARRASACLFFNIVMAILLVGVYGKVQADLTANRLVVSLLSLSVAVGFVAATLGIGYLIKLDLERVRRT